MLFLDHHLNYQESMIKKMKGSGDFIFDLVDKYD